MGLIWELIDSAGAVAVLTFTAWLLWSGEYKRFRRGGEHEEEKQ